MFVVAQVFAEQVAFGANGAALALAFAAVQAGLLAWMVAMAWSRGALRRVKAPWVPALLYLGVVVAQLVSLTPAGAAPNAPIWAPLHVPPSIAIDHGALVVEVVKLLGLACLFHVGLVIGRDRPRAWLALRAIVTSGLVYAVFSLTLHFYSPTSLFGYTIWTGPERLAATLGSANIAGAFFGLLLLCVTAVLLQHRRDVAKSSYLWSRQLDLWVRRAALDIVSLVLFATCLMMTGSRGAAAATASMLLFLLVCDALASGLNGGRWAPPILLAAAFIGAFAFAGDMVARRFQDSAQAAADRLALFDIHWRAFEQSPWLGSGLGAFRDLNAALMTKANYGQLVTMGATHNVFVQWLEQGGCIGAALMWGCIGWLLSLMLAGAVGRFSLSAVPRLVVACSGLLILHGLTDFALEVPSIAAFWALLLGLGVARGRR